MKLPALKDCVRGKVHFLLLRDDNLWYRCDNGFEFPISPEEIKGATWLPEDKALMFMRWIRKHLDWLRECMEADDKVIQGSSPTGQHE